MNTRLIIILVLLSAASALGQAKKWTLEECVEYAVENNLSVSQFELDLENAVIDKSDAIGALLPDFNVSANASKNVGFTIVSTSNIPVTGNQSTFNVNGGFSSNLTLFNGLRNIRQVHRAKMNALANQYRLDDLKDDIRLNVANAYLQILSNKEALLVFGAQYAAIKQDLERTKELVDAGVVPQGDLLEVEATAANLEQQIVETENQVLISTINLAQLLQITDYENFDIADADYEVPPSDILNKSAKEIFAEALTFRNDIKLAKSNIDLALEDLKINKGAYLPTLTGFFQYGTRYSDATQPIPDGSGSFFTPGFIDQLWIFDGISYGAQLSIPIFNGFSTRNNVKRSQINVRQAELQLEQNKLELETNINQAYVDVKGLSKAYYAAQKTAEARRLSLEYAQERFDVGLLNAFEFSQAQARVNEAEATVVRTKYDYIFRIKVLEFYFGVPMELN